MTLYLRFADHLNAALDALVASGDLPAGLERRAVTVEPPRDASHGDLATNAALVLTKQAGRKPREIADLLAGELRKNKDVTEVSVAGPGFVNLRLSDDFWRARLKDVLVEGREVRVFARRHPDDPSRIQAVEAPETVRKWCE